MSRLGQWRINKENKRESVALKDYTIVTSESVTGEELERKRGEGKSCLRNCIEKKQASKKERGKKKE